MAKKIKGIVVEIEGKSTGFKSAVKDVTKEAKSLTWEMNNVNRLLKFDPTNTVLLAQKQELLSQNITKTGEKLEMLKQAEANAQEQFAKGEITQKEYRDLQREVIVTTQKITEHKTELDKMNGVLSESEKKQLELTQAMEAKTAADEAAIKAERELSSELNVHNSEIEITKTNMEKNITSTEKNTNAQGKLRLEKISLNKQRGIEQQKLEILNKQLKSLTDAENKNEAAIASKKVEISKSELEMVKYTNAIKDVNTEMSQLTIATQNMDKMSKLSINTGKALAPISGIAIAAATASVVEATALEDTEAKYETVFGDFVKDANMFIDKFQELTPVTQAQAQSLSSGLQDMIMPMGFARQEATKMTGEFFHVIGALTNFNSDTETAESVSDKFRQALTGEYTGLKKFGIVLNDTVVRQKAVEYGFAKSTKEVSTQAKAQVVLKESYAKSKDALAAYNEESLDFKTKSQLALTMLKDIGAELGVVLLPILSDLVSIFKGVLSKFQNMDESTKKMIMKILLLVGALSPLLLVLGKLLEIGGSVGKMIKSVTSSTNALGSTMKLLSASPITMMVTALLVLVGTFAYLYATSEEFREKVDAVINGISEKIQKFCDFFVKIFTVNLPNAWKFLVDGIKGGINFILSGFNALIDGANSLVEKINGLKLPDWLGGKSLGFSFQKIDKIELLKDSKGNNAGSLWGKGNSSYNYNNQRLATSSYYDVKIDAKNVKEFNDIVKISQTASQKARAK